MFLLVIPQSVQRGSERRATVSSERQAVQACAQLTRVNGISVLGSFAVSVGLRGNLRYPINCLPADALLIIN